MQYVVNTKEELKDTLTKVVPGDSIGLNDAQYGDLVLNGTKGLSLFSKNYLGATFSRITLETCENVDIQGVEVSSDTNGTDGAGLVTILNSKNIMVLGCEVHGKVDQDYTGWWGLYTKNSESVVLRNNYVHDVNVGIVCFESKNVVVSENIVDWVGKDAMKFSLIVGAAIENNFGPRQVHRDSMQQHLDFIQFQGSSRNIVIRGNVVLPQNEYTAQGIFMSDGTYDNVLIENNVIVNALLRGISVSSGTGIIVRNNTLVNPAMNATLKLSVISVPTGAVKTGNIESYNTNNSGLKDGNLVMQWNDVTKPYHYDTVYTKASKGYGLSMEDLRPVKGSLGETMGAFARIAELLEPEEPEDPQEPDELRVLIQRLIELLERYLDATR